MAVISISRQFGAGGWTLGSAVARRLGYKFVSHDIVNKTAQEANVSVKWVQSIEKEAGDWLSRFTSKLVSSSFIERHIGEGKSDFDEKKYVDFLRKLIPAIAARDNVVILGRGSQYILQDDPNTIKILMVAELEDRITFIEKIWEVKRSEAEKFVLMRQKRINAFLKNFEPRGISDPSLYHITLNTSKLDLKHAENMIVNMVKQLGQPS